MTPGTQTTRLWSLVCHSLFAIFVSTIAACASSGIYQQDLMNAPDIYDEGGIDPFADNKNTFCGGLTSVAPTETD